MLETDPIKTLGGLLCLINDLTWNEELPLFLTGVYAGLRLGPGADNLAGASQSAKRVAWKVQDKHSVEDVPSANRARDHAHKEAFVEGYGSHFAAISI